MIALIPTNNKANEVSYTRFHTRRLLIRLWEALALEKDGLSSLDRDKSFIHSFLIMPKASIGTSSMECNNWRGKGILHVTSEKTAQQVLDACYRLSPCACKFLAKKGVLVGPKNRKPILLEEEEKECVMEFYNKGQGCLLNLDSVGSYVFLYPKAFMNKTKYNIGEFVVLKEYASLSNGQGESNFWRRLKKIFSHEQGEQNNVFVMVEIISQGCNNLDKISGMPLVHKSQRVSSCVIIQPIECLMHKFFWLRSSSDDVEVLYEVSGRKVRSRLVHVGEIGCAPPWIEEGDHVLVKKEGSQRKEAIVIGIDQNGKQALISWLDEVHGEDAWVDLKLILARLPQNEDEA